MELFIIRHAQASRPGGKGSDFDRNLTQAGLLQASKLGSFLKEKAFAPELLLTSPFLRARETAQVLAKHLTPLVAKRVDWLRCGMSPQQALQELSKIALQYQKVALVGHQPDLSILIESLDKEGRLASVPVCSLHHFEGSLVKAGGKVQRLAY